MTTELTPRERRHEWEKGQRGEPHARVVLTIANSDERVSETGPRAAVSYCCAAHERADLESAEMQARLARFRAARPTFRPARS